MLFTCEKRSEGSDLFERGVSSDEGGLMSLLSEDEEEGRDAPVRSQIN